MHQNIKASLTKAQFPTPLYSPRTTYSNHIKEISSLKTNMIINIDKYILGNLKAEFNKRGKQISLIEFVYFAKKYLKDWNNDLYGRDVKMDECLMEVWKEIDLQNRGKITWEEFNSKIIETSLNLKSLSNNAGIQAPSFKELTIPFLPNKYENSIAKIIYLKGKGKMAFFREQAIQLQFFSTEPANEQSTLAKPLLLPQQQLKVETMIKVKEKKDTAAGQKVIKQPQKMIKKDLKVSSYKNIVMDAIYLEDEKYDMLLVSSSDKFVRGYNVSGIVPFIEVQPQNEDEPMIHPFPVEIYAMAWDPINQVLYATGKHPKIYQWVVKTDSERQMADPKGHDNMISVMMMMPKLQLLATGGYDGKMVLWDTVGQVVKCKYEEHARAISSIAFHQGLILLFTSSYDHKICIWNPYITSLIHKIDNSLNVISIEIIPNTNYLLALDCGGTVKIREINRFTQVASFSILRSDVNEDNEALGKQDKTDRELSISMCSKKDDQIQYYFGTQKVVGYEYFEIEKNSIVGGSINEMKYDPLRFKLLTPLKNHVVVWNLLTGKMEQIFYDMTENDITAIDIAPELGFFICGDVEGNVIQRKLSNGFLIKNLTKIKGAVNTMKFYQLERNQKEKSLKKTFLLFCTTQQGEVTVFKCHPKSEFILHKQFSIRTDFLISHGNLSGIEYFCSKNILGIKLNTNELLFVDVQKRSLLIKIQFGESILGSMNVVDYKDTYYFAIWNKTGQLTGFHLPPHPKKFKASCCLQLDTIQKPETSIYAQKSNRYFFSTQKCELFCLPLIKKYLEVDYYTPTLNIQWKVKLDKRVSSMLLIENQKILIILTQAEEIIFIDVGNGDVICKMRQGFKGQIQNFKEPEPILYFKQKSYEIYIPNEDKVIKLDPQELQQTKYQRIVNPTFFIDLLISRNLKNFNKLSSSNWDLELQFSEFVDKKIKEIQQIEVKLNNGVQKLFEKKGPTDVQKRIQKALQLQKKWQKQKDNENLELSRNPYSMSKLQRTTKNFQKSIQRNNSISMLWKSKEQASKKLSEHSFVRDKKIQRQMIATKSKFSQVQKPADPLKLRSDPLYRLGQALKSVDTGDKKAENFIQMAKKKQELKLPKLALQKGK